MTARRSHAISPRGLLVLLLTLACASLALSSCRAPQPEVPQAQAPQPQIEPTQVPQPPAPQAQAPQPQIEPAQVPQAQAPQAQAPAEIRLAGIWASQDMTLYGMMSTQMILQPNGAYAYQVVLGDLMTYEVGTYEQGDGFIHFTVEDFEPKVYKGTQMYRPTSWTVFYTVVDENTMIWEDRILGTRWMVHRQQ